MTRWIPLRDEFLSELLQQDSPPSNSPTCATCGIHLRQSSVRKMQYDVLEDLDSDNDFDNICSWQVKCVDCIHSPVTCVDCLINSHMELPLHRAMVRNVTNFIINV